MTLYVTIAALIVSACVLAVALIALNGLEADAVPLGVEPIPLIEDDPADKGK